MIKGNGSVVWKYGVVELTLKLRIENGELRIVDEILTDFHDKDDSDA